MAQPHFSLRLTLCGVVLAGLSGCTYLIPEDPSVPRHNTVQGERHRPVKNNTPVTSPGPGAQNMSPMAAPVAPVAMNELPAPAPMPLPPVSPEVQAKANMQIANDPGLSAASARQVPSENRSFTLAENTTGAGLMNVPPHPVNAGANSPSARLDEARRDLEQSRADALQAKTQLSREVAAEPTAFPEIRTPAPMPQQRSSVVPAAPQARTASASTALPPLPPMAPARVEPLRTSSAPAPMVMASAPVAPVVAPAPVMATRSFDPMAPVPPAPPAMKPIQLTPPVAAAPAPAPAPVTVQARAETPAAVSSLPPTSSDFNPLAGAQVASSGYTGGSSSTGYLPPSRYASRR